MEKITSNFIVSYKKMTKKQFNAYVENMSKKDSDIVTILKTLSNKPRFSIDMVQKEYLKVSKHFNSEKNNEKNINSSDLIFIKSVFKCCFYLAKKEGIYINFALQNGIVTFLKSNNDIFVISENNKEGGESGNNPDDVLKKCFENCTKKIKLDDVSDDTLKAIIKTLEKHLKK